jgi:hypothetical protein
MECDDVPLDENAMINYNFEAIRLFSLIKSRPFPNPYVSVYDLAKNGFYYTGNDDNCRCHFCKLEVRGWEPGDTAKGEHERWNPRCPILSTEACPDNVPIGSELDSDQNHDTNPFVKPDLTVCE